MTGPLRLLRDRVETLLIEHTRAAREVDGQPWRDIAALGVHVSAVTNFWPARPARSVPRPGGTRVAPG